VGYGPLGGMGYTHAYAVQQTAGLELAAICDSNARRLQSALADFPSARAYASVEDVARDAAVDVAIVATPPSSHTALVLQLLNAGKHVVCEKPLCFTLDEADHLFDTALVSGLMLTVNQNRRWDSDYLTIRHVIDAGLLGAVFNVETFVGSFEHPCREWHSEASISGGAEFDWGAHYIDWILQLMPGMPVSVMANGHKRVWHDVSNLDQVRVRLLWEDGREAEFLHSDVAAVRQPKFYIQGTEATLVGHYRPLVSERIEPGRGFVREESHHAEAPADLTLVRYEPLGGGLREQHLSLLQRDPLAFYRNLADHLLFDDEPLAVDHHSMRRLISVLEAAHKSTERGGRPMTPA
jgi:predicted dehydrogenase